MNKLVKDYETQKKLLIDALVEKDYLEIYEAVALKNEFVIKLGEPRYVLHKMEMAIAKNKLKLDMIETVHRFQMQMDTQYIDKQLNEEFEKHEIMLRRMESEIEKVHDSIGETGRREETLRLLKNLYLSIASYIHPEVVQHSDRNTQKIWESTKAAFEKRDLPKMKRLHKKVLNIYSRISPVKADKEELKKEIDVLKTKTDSVLSEIKNLKEQFPFNEAVLLEDEAAVSRVQKEMEKDIEIARQVLDKLEKQILEKLPAPGGYLN